MKRSQFFQSLFQISLIIVLVFANHTRAQIPSTDVHIPSEAGGEEGIAVRIIRPLTSRYSQGAPVVVYVIGGTSGSGINSAGVKLARQGFIEIHFNFPGSGVAPNQSGGIYDQRGPECLKALRDVIRFALGEWHDTQGKSLSDITAPITPLPTNVGLIGLSHGGNSTISVAGVHGAEISTLAWIVNWESPVGDGMPTAEAGAIHSTTNPINNPAYNPDTGEFDLSLLAYDDTVSINLHHAFSDLGEIHGGLYFDINQNSQVDMGTDFVAYPFIYELNDTVKVFYSVRLMEEATNRNLFPEDRPSHIPTLAQTREFWYWRNGENWIEKAVQNIPQLMFIVEASVTDHVQSAPDHPHVLIQYEGFRSAGARFVRLNPDRSYVEYILNDSAPTVTDNSAFTPFDHISIRSALEPPRNEGFPLNITVAAAACELADRTQWDNVEPQIDYAITSVGKADELPDDFELLQNYPNPFNSETMISYRLNRSSHVTLSIHNAVGQQVCLVEDALKPAGVYRVHWDGKDDLGNPVNSGVYFYHLQLDDGTTRTKKLLLIK